MNSRLVHAPRNGRVPFVFHCEVASMFKKPETARQRRKRQSEEYRSEFYRKMWLEHNAPLEREILKPEAPWTGTFKEAGREYVKGEPAESGREYVKGVPVGSFVSLDKDRAPLCRCGRCGHDEAILQVGEKCHYAKVVCHKCGLDLGNLSRDLLSSVRKSEYPRSLLRALGHEEK